MATATSNLTSYDSGYSAHSVSTMDNALAGSTSTSYAQLDLTRGQGGVTQIYYNFSFNIPTDATDISVSCLAKGLISTTTSARIATRQVQLYSGSTAKGSATNIANTTSAYTLTAGTWTASQVNNAKLRWYVVRGTSNTNTNYYLRIYGATMTVSYTEPVTGNKVYVKSNGTWQQASKIHIKVGGVWEEVSKVFKKVNGAWVQQSDNSALFDPNAIYKKG